MTDRKINLILGSYAHVPYGAPDQEFESVYEKLIKPFITTLYKNPHIQSVLHYSGVLLYWIERSHPELFMLIEDMVSRKQVEFLGGGFYEPMLPLIPLQDKIGQIEFFTTYIRKHFGKRPQGCWIPGMAWEQNLVGPLSACGMGYTFLDEDQFLKAGMNPDDLYWPCLTEDQGKLITVFPVFNSIEKELAAENVQTVFKRLHERLPDGKDCTVSVFPQVIFSAPNEAVDYAWSRFFEELTLSESIITSAVPSKIFKGHGKLKRVYFPDSACSRGVPPRNFLISCPEANNIYSKMVFTNLLINQLRGDKARKLNAREELWKAQGYSLFCCAESLYRHCLRKAAYRSLLSVERITRDKSKFVPSVIQLDFNFDDINEYLFQDQKINCYIQTAGASVFELDYLPRAWNYLDTCNFYGTGKAVSPDRILYRRAAFTDNFYVQDTNYQKLIANEAAPQRCCAGDYYSVEEPENKKGKVVFNLPPNPSVPFGSVGISKAYLLKKDTLTVSYTLTNHESAKAHFLFIPEIDLSFPCEGQEYVRMFKCKAGAKDAAVTEPVIHDTECIKIQDLKNEAQIMLSSTCPFDACIAQRHISLNGVDLYQSTGILPVFNVELGSNGIWDAELSLKFSN